MEKIFHRVIMIGLFAIVVAANHLQSQTVPRVAISGQVKDAATGKPLANVNVFLANTMLGAVTDQEGFYSIKQAPLGAHELVGSLIGYEVHRQALRLSEARELWIDFSLAPKTLQIAEVEVVAEPPKEWKKNLQKFEELFWGNSYDASKCKILNPEILDFTVEKESHTFFAAASQPIQIENRLLGYRAQIILDEFQYDLEKGIIKYRFIPKYEVLAPADASEEAKWQENRRKAYRGSFRHFLCAITAERLFVEGFKAFLLPALPWEDKNVNRQTIDPRRLIVATDTPYEKKLQFNGVLEITYMHGLRQEETSWLMMKTNSATVNTSGYANNPYELMIYGYWFYERLALTLPLDYEP